MSSADRVDDSAASVMIGADELAELEEERRFLLRSLADLEREREAGDVDDADYLALRDGYTTRAAIVLRAIDAGRSARQRSEPRRWSKLVLIIVGLVVAASALGIAVARYASPRGSGDTITGGSPADQVAALLSEGRSLLSVFDYGGALDRYRAALEIDADNVEARAYSGWVLAQASTQQAAEEAARTLAAGKQFLADAIAIDPTYADPHCFLAIIADQIDDDADVVTAERALCLDNNASAEMRALVDQFAPDPALSTTTTTAVAATTTSTSAG